ncbi:MAG: hypothetical protein R3264_09525 [Anaerolineae bacterium]|nr:hypothetical protein [Anaerolineae bacterium]
MTTWEYCAIRADINSGKNYLKFFSEGSPSEIKDVHESCAQLGREGWELVTLTQISQPDSRVYYFKRPQG